MDEPGLSWPAWKFGLKREDLFTKLHDQYNTFPSAIQDPEAFHHDVYEISTSASSSDEFHRLLAERRQQRLAELENGLESASLEIIANPKLIGTAQWQFALQLFRTKSLDSLVRYFSSYLPDNHHWHRTDSSASTTAVASFTEEVNESEPFFFDRYHDDKPILTHEPLSISTDIPTHHLPPSPRSLTMCSDSCSVSPTDKNDHDQDYIFSNLTPARTLSFSETESECLVYSATLSHNKSQEDLVRFDAVDTPSTSVSDISEVRSLNSDVEEEEEDIPETQVEDSEDSHDAGDVESTGLEDAPTPRTEMAPTAESKQTASLYTRVLHEYVRSSSWRSRDRSPGGLSRKSPGLSNSRVQKQLPDSTRTKTGCRRRLDC